MGVGKNLLNFTKRDVKGWGFKKEIFSVTYLLNGPLPLIIFFRRKDYINKSKGSGYKEEYNLSIFLYQSAAKVCIHNVQSLISLLQSIRDKRIFFYIKNSYIGEFSRHTILNNFIDFSLVLVALIQCGLLLNCASG